MNKNTVIGLFGMYGLYNYGCEAIVRGTYTLLKKAYPNSEIILYTTYPEKDKVIIEDLDVTVKPIPLKKFYQLKRIINKIFRTINIYKQLDLWNAKNVSKECDIIFSVGGDIYTIPKHLIDTNNYHYNPIISFGEEVLKHVPFIIWGASIGPFGENKYISNYYFNHLKKVKQIFCREEKTYSYLHNNNFDNIEITSDPAFYVEVAESKQDKKRKIKKIALNLSELSIREQVGEDSCQMECKIIDAIKDICTIPDIKVVLIPHVICETSDRDNDLIYLNRIYNFLEDKYKDRVEIYTKGDGFIKTKLFLRTCDVVIAARMHCAINAICEGIPTIFLCYSQKGKGMAQFVYGNDKWAVELEDINSNLKNKVLEMMDKENNVKLTIQNKLIEIKQNELLIVEKLKELIGD